MSDESDATSSGAASDGKASSTSVTRDSDSNLAASPRKVAVRGGAA